MESITKLTLNEAAKISELKSQTLKIQKERITNNVFVSFSYLLHLRGYLSLHVTPPEGYTIQKQIDYRGLIWWSSSSG